MKSGFLLRWLNGSVTNTHVKLPKALSMNVQITEYIKFETIHDLYSCVCEVSFEATPCALYIGVKITIIKLHLMPNYTAHQLNKFQDFPIFIISYW